MVKYGMIKEGAGEKGVKGKDGERIDILRSRVGLLGGKDRAIMEIYLAHAGTFRQMARLAGVNEATIARRIHKLVRRLLDGQYITCLKNSSKLSSEQIEISRDYFVAGLPMNEIAQRREIPYYRVRMTMQKIQKLTAITQTY
jgi:predicted DNA-binding protein YlxM (UPF0122 family)